MDWLQAQGITLRSSVHLGATLLLFDLVGAPEGSWGPLVGLALLGVAWDLSPNLQIIIEPAEVMMPIVQLEPVPFYYRQYRLAIGLQWNP